jgi:hypothetical protein
VAEHQRLPAQILVDQIKAAPAAENRNDALRPPAVIADGSSEKTFDSTHLLIQKGFFSDI